MHLPKINYSNQKYIIMTLMKEFSNPAVFAYATNWIFGIGIIQYPLGKFHPKTSFIYTVAILSIYCILAVYAYPYILELRIAENYVTIKLLYYSNIVLNFGYVALGWQRSAVSCIKRV